MKLSPHPLHPKISVEAKTKEAALSSYRTYNNNVPQSLFNDGFIALQNLFKQDGLAIQKSDNGNSVGIVDRQNYIEKMERKGIKNRQKVTIVNMKDDTLLNFTVNQEKHAEKVLKKLVESNNVTEKNRKLLKPVGSA